MAKNQDGFKRLICCINSSENGLIPYECEAIPEENLPMALSDEDFEFFPDVCINAFGERKELAFRLSYNELTDNDIEILISSLIKKPLIAANVILFDFSYNNLKKLPVILKSDFPKLTSCVLSGNPVIEKSSLAYTMSDLRIGVHHKVDTYGLTCVLPKLSPDRENIFSDLVCLFPQRKAKLSDSILDKYFTNLLTEYLIDAYSNLITINSLNLKGKTLFNNIGLRIITYLAPQPEKILEYDLSNIEKRIKKEEPEVLAFMQKYKQERLPFLLQLYKNKLLNAGSNSVVKSLCDLNSFIAKNDFNAQNLNMQNLSGYIPHHLAAKNMCSKFFGLNKHAEDYYLITKALYYRRNVQTRINPPVLYVRLVISS